MTFDVVAARGLVLGRLAAQTGLNVYDGEVPADPPRDPDGRVHPYAVLYAGAPLPRRDSVTNERGGVDWTFQVTAVGGDAQRCAWAGRAVQRALDGAMLDQPGQWTTGPLTQLPGPGMAVDSDVTPPRHFQPLLYQLVAVDL